MMVISSLRVPLGTEVVTRVARPRAMVELATPLAEELLATP